MADLGHIGFFKVDRCGLHKYRSAKIYGCGLYDTFKLIKNWVKNRPQSETIPWDPSVSRTNKSKCYCKDIYEDESNGDFMLVLWKSDTDKSGSLYGMAEEDTTGKGDAVEFSNEHKGKPVIWGRPCYYWIATKANVIASIKFDFSVTDAQLFEDYIIACINNRVKYINRRTEISEKGHVQVYFSDEDDEETKLRFRFKMSLKSLSTSSAELGQLARKVTHIVRRETIKISTKNERAEWIKMFTKHMPFVSAKPKSKSRRVEISAEAKPNAVEIKEIIEKFAIENPESQDWENVGFRTETGTTWVDRYRLRGRLTVIEKSGTLPSAKEVYKVIKKQRGKFLKTLEGKEKTKVAEA